MYAEGIAKARTQRLRDPVTAAASPKKTGLRPGTIVSWFLTTIAVCWSCVQGLCKEAKPMKTRLRLAMIVAALCAWVLGSTVAARAQDNSALGALLALADVMNRALSMPSLGGPTGIVSVPNALTMPEGTWQAALSYQGMRASASGMYQPPDDLSVWLLQAARRLNDTAEVWATYSSGADHEGSRVWGLGGKRMLTHLEGGGPFAAVGASYHRWDDAFVSGSRVDGAARPDANVVKAYAMVTGVLTGESWAPLLGTAGVMHIRLDPDIGSSESLTRPFLGLQAVYVGTTLGLEYRWRDSTLDAKPVFSAAIRQVLSDELTVELGTTNASPVGTGLSAQRLFLRLSHAL